MKKNIIFLLAAIAISCVDYIDNSTYEILSRDESCVVKKISSKDSLLTVNDASIVARLEKFGIANTKSNDTKTVQEVITLNNIDGTPIMYAVNFNGGGYTLVSATKKYYPILAQAENGSFSEEMYNTGLAILLDEYEKSIDICESQPKDSLVKIRFLWNKYEEFEQKKIITTKSDALFNLVSSSIRQWNEQEIQYYFLSEGCPNFITEEQYQNYISLAREYGNPNYNYMENSVILVKTTERHSSKGPLTTTAWSQHGIYNDKIQQLYYADLPAGCVPIAIGQIMAYHRYPSIYDWDKILAGESPDVPDLIYNLAISTNTQFSMSGSTSDIVHAQDYLERAGYTCQKIDHDKNLVWNSLGRGKPVYMQGERIKDVIGHAWVCDGYVYDATDVTVSLQVVSYNEPLIYQGVGDTYTFTTDALSFYMNWGLGNTSSLHTTSGISSDWYNANQYIYDRQDLIYITKPLIVR